MNKWDWAGHIRRYREAHGLLQEQLADKIGIGRSTISSYETGQNKQPSGENAIKIVALMGPPPRMGEEMVPGPDMPTSPSQKLSDLQALIVDVSSILPAAVPIYRGLPDHTDRCIVDYLYIPKSQQEVPGVQIEGLLWEANSGTTTDDVKPGNVVILRARPKPVPGDIVLCRRDGEWMIGNYHRDDATGKDVIQNNSYTMPVPDVHLMRVIVAILRFIKPPMVDRCSPPPQ